MKLSVKSDYACRAVLWLARHHPEGVARRVEDMASEHNISPNYLVQILIELKAGRIVKSQRGKEGGYLLGRPPAEITMGEVLRCVYGQIFESPAMTDPMCPTELREAWKSLQRGIDQSADKITFQQLVDQGSSKERMFYI